jgi:hypothetical protein
MLLRFAAVKTQLQENKDQSHDLETANKLILSLQEGFSAKMDAELESDRKLLGEAEARIAELNEQLSARPSIPLNVTDPALSLTTVSQDKDETGKQILSALPKDLKRKLKN